MARDLTRQKLSTRSNDGPLASIDCEHFIFIMMLVMTFDDNRYSLLQHHVTTFNPSSFVDCRRFRFLSCTVRSTTGGYRVTPRRIRTRFHFDGCCDPFPRHHPDEARQPRRVVDAWHRKAGPTGPPRASDFRVLILYYYPRGRFVLINTIHYFRYTSVLFHKD